MDYYKKRFILAIISGCFFLLTNMVNVDAAEAKWMMIGNLHNFYQAHGCEPEEDYGSEQQWGLRWPAFFDHQDMQAAKGMWIAVRNFKDPLNNDQLYDYKVVHCGPRPRPEIEENEFMPADYRIKLIGKFQHPLVYVDGESATDLQYNDVVDAIDPDLTCDRLIQNRVNTSVGISFTRNIYGWSQQYYSDFLIYEYIFENTGIYNRTGDVMDPVPTHEGVYFHWQYRNAIAGEGTVEGVAIDWLGRPGWGTPRDMRWGINTMNDVIGETPDSPVLESDFPDMGYVGRDEFDDKGEIIRAFYSWHGKHSGVNDYDNIGSPNFKGYKHDGRLGAYQYVGVATLHADKSPDDRSDDQYQPSSTNFIESNSPATRNNDQFDPARMQSEYEDYCACGHPADGSHAEQVGNDYPNKFCKDGGMSQSIAFGPYRMEPGDKIRIVLAEAAAGLARDFNIDPNDPNDVKNDLRRKVGNDWYRVVVDGESVNVTYPDRSTGTIKDEKGANEYKNLWVYTGRDSIISTFKKAISLFNDSLNLGNANPPLPPSSFEVTSLGNYIHLEWNRTDPESHPNFEGYKIYRALGSMYDSTYYLIADLNAADGNLVGEFDDYTAIRGESYYYYIVAYDNGVNNPFYPGVPLHSSPFYTRTNKPASLVKPPSEGLDDIVIVPNPYNIRNTSLNFTNEPNKIMFFNLPEECDIKIYTERGDLIFKKHHRGSGDDTWNMLTSSRQIVVSGVYIVTFETPKGEKTFRKLVVIR